MSYRLEHSLSQTEAQGEQPEQSLMFPGNRSEGRLPGLQPYSVYNISIRVLNNKGEGPASQTVTFKTPEGGTGQDCGRNADIVGFVVQQRLVLHCECCSAIALQYQARRPF